MRRIGELLAAPDQRAGLLVERDDGPFGPAGSDYHLVAVDQGRFSKAPLGTPASEVFLVVLAPEFLAGGCFKANQLAPLADGDQQAALDGRRGAGSIKGRHTWRAGFAE